MPPRDRDLRRLRIEAGNQFEMRAGGSGLVSSAFQRLTSWGLQMELISYPKGMAYEKDTKTVL